MRKASKWFAVLLAIVLVASLGLTGCGDNTDTPKSGDPKTEGEKPDSGETGKQHITYNNGAEPETIDPAKASGAPDLTVINTVFEGLVRYDKETKIQPGMAKTWDVSPDGKTYTFHLRDAKWSNGDPVTAEDFVFACERLLNPETAADYAYELYYLVNGEQYNSGEITDFSQVGVKALDAKTLEVQLTGPAPQFLGLTAFSALMPVNKNVASADPDWATKVETYIGNGPFKLEKWEKNQKMEFVKNDNYWDKDAVKLESLTYTAVAEESTELNMFETDQIDFGDNPPLEEIERLINEGVVTVGGDLSSYYYVFNTEAAPFDDVRVRKAFAMAINREAIVKNVTKAGQIPAFAYVPPGLPDADTTKDFREVGGDFFTEDLAKAKELLAEAGYPDAKGLPKIELLTNDGEGHLKIAQAIMEMWKQNLGVTDISIVSQEWGVYLKSRDEGNYQVARAGWGADYLDAMTFIDMYTTTGGNNDTNWSNAQYDEDISKANTESSRDKRFEYMHDAEKLMMEDMIIMPIYYYTNPYYVKEYVKDYIVPTFGANVEFKWAYVEKH